MPSLKLPYSEGYTGKQLMAGMRRIRVFINPKAGMWWSSTSLQQILQEHWDVPGSDLTYQYSKSAEDGKEKTLCAIRDGVDTILTVGGDGMVNSIGSVLVGTNVALGVIPAGSGNGFARHFGIPLSAERAVRALVDAERMTIDVGTANKRPFFVTCSMAWDAALVRTFEKSPVRGVLPYVFAAAFESLAYKPQPFEVVIDKTEQLIFDRPFVFTVANLTQYGGGAQVAPHARPDDGYLELVVLSRDDAPRALTQLPRLFDGTIEKVPGVITRRFKTLEVHRRESAAVQVDGELVEEPADVSVTVMPRALTVLVPRG